MIEQQQNVTVISNQRPVQLRVERLAIHHRMKILEAVKSNGSKFYLFFYKDDFITGKTVDVKNGSLIEKAFKNGIVLQASHPLIERFLTDKTFLLKSTKQVFQSIQKHYTPQETAFIFSYFDSFLSTETLIKLIRKHFYEYRRNGQLRKAFQILVILLHFDSNNKWGLELTRKLEYQKMRSIYEAEDTDLRDVDPLFFEIVAYKELEKNQTYLESVYHKDKRKTDLTALRLHLYLHSSKQDERDPLTLLEGSFTESEYANLLWIMYVEAPQHKILQEKAFQALMHLNKTSEAINLLTARKAAFTASEGELLVKAFNDEETDITQINLSWLQESLKIKENRMLLEGLLQPLIPRILNEYGLTYVYTWLKPLYEGNQNLSILSTIQTMVDIQDNPDKQFQLGKLYHKLKQYDDAITCFDWEMELHPTDPTPVQWLTKVYREMGKLEESNTYMSIYSKMQRVSH
ncbi:hypothetical protein Q9251_15070 [Alkalihalobacillus macyae]|uniref:tetratricopeptide repeat protein n=1 Tax=Guptibacillus hwajinpoensis TaxID=208199 RepID=UPI00273B8D79|nr:hypothetical protein [Alkalihalobacillus macyae]MDP4552197.1 hypothetical protein [Alkalihalobacillus macyae]